MIWRGLVVAALGAMLMACSASKAIRPTESRAAPFHLFIMPVRGVQPSQLTDNYAESREHGRRHHDGLDIRAKTGTEVLACVGGTILQIKLERLGGNTIWLRGVDGRDYYYAHLSRYADIHEGQDVAPGDVIGYVGQTGDATGPHLHFEVHQERGTPALDPYPILTQSGILVMAY